MIWTFPLLFGIPKTFETSFLMQQSSQTQSILRLKEILRLVVIVQARMMLMVSLWINVHNNNYWAEAGWKAGFSRAKWVYNVMNVAWPQRGDSVGISHCQGQFRKKVKQHILKKRVHHLHVVVNNSSLNTGRFKWLRLWTLNQIPSSMSKQGEHPTDFSWNLSCTTVTGIFWMKILRSICKQGSESNEKP